MCPAACERVGHGPRPAAQIARGPSTQRLRKHAAEYRLISSGDVSKSPAPARSSALISATTAQLGATAVGDLPDWDLRARPQVPDRWLRPYLEKRWASPPFLHRRRTRPTDSVSHFMEQTGADGAASQADVISSSMELSRLGQPRSRIGSMVIRKHSFMNLTTDFRVCYAGRQKRKEKGRMYHA